MFNRESPIPLQQLRESCNDCPLDKPTASASAPEIKTAIDIPHYIVPGRKSEYAIVVKKDRLKILKDNTGFFLRVFNPFAPSHLKQNLQKVFTGNEKEKKRQYNSRVIEVEHGSFTPLVFSAYGGSSQETERTISETSSKRQSRTKCSHKLVRTKLSFAILRSAVLSIRGSRTVRKNEVITDPAEIEIGKAVGQTL